MIEDDGEVSGKPSDIIDLSGIEPVIIRGANIIMDEIMRAEHER
jgi:tRNA A37 threonylcarbamoyladenosine synthetase subunit TsaC/SUA5/YrdC